MSLQPAATLRTMLDPAAVAIERVYRDGKLINATIEARRILRGRPNTAISVDDFTLAIARLATARGVTVEFGDGPQARHAEARPARQFR